MLHIVKNYTGDVLNFRMAAELAEDDGIEVESVVMDDDVAVQDSLYTAGRRGVGATVLAEKIAGARAEAGGTLAEVADVAKRVNEQRALVRRRADVVRDARERARRSSTSAADEIEIGVGIHGEPGRRRESSTRTAHEIVEMMLEPILEDLKPAPASSCSRSSTASAARR